MAFQLLGFRRGAECCVGARRAGMISLFARLGAGGESAHTVRPDYRRGRWHHRASVAVAAAQLRALQSSNRKLHQQLPVQLEPVTTGAL